VSIVRKTIPSIKRTVLKDFKDIMQTFNLWDSERINNADRIYTFINNARVQFINTDDPDKLRGVKSDILFIDEASEITEEAYFQLSIRTAGKILLAYNPTISPYHWLRQMEDCERYITTYKDNPFIPKEMVEGIEKLQETNEKYWKIYGLGEFAQNDKAIFQFNIINQIPIDATELLGFGMDFGYTNDPTALVAVYKLGDTLYLRELIYETHLLARDIIGKIRSFDIGKNEIWADSADPRMVEEIYRAGINIKGVQKPPGSKNFGIALMQNYKLVVERNSQNLINELYSYQWIEDKNGIVLNEADKGLDHAIDAARYLIMSKLNVINKNKKSLIVSSIR
jgi:phage terminase large subunit